jgi:hypothetical protein
VITLDQEFDGAAIVGAASTRLHFRTRADGHGALFEYPERFVNHVTFFMTV